MLEKTNYDAAAQSASANKAAALAHEQTAHEDAQSHHHHTHEVLLMSQNSILLEKSLHFSVRIVKLHRLLHRHEDDLSAELLKHAAAIGSAVSCADCALSRRDLAESLNEALRETAQTEYWLRLLTLTDDVDVRTGASLLSDCTELRRLLTAAASAAN